jgi:hypothetical protein
LGRRYNFEGHAVSTEILVARTSICQNLASALAPPAAAVIMPLLPISSCENQDEQH